MQRKSSSHFPHILSFSPQLMFLLVYAAAAAVVAQEKVGMTKKHKKSSASFIYRILYNMQPIHIFLSFVLSPTNPSATTSMKTHIFARKLIFFSCTAYKTFAGTESLLARVSALSFVEPFLRAKRAWTT